MLKEGILMLSRSSAAKTLMTRTPLRSMSERFVPGESVDSLLGAIRDANAGGMAATANYLGEAEHDRESARAAVRTYLEIVDRIHDEELDAGISAKPSQLGAEIGVGFFLETIRPLLERARDRGVFVRLDMESSELTETTLEAFETLWGEGRRGIGIVLQAHLRRTRDDIRRMNELGAGVRICKGAYVEPEEIAYPSREEVRESFAEAMQLLLSEGRQPAVATHDPHLIRKTIRFASEHGIGPERFEFQMLHGVRRDLQRRIVSDGWRLRVYIPFGESWYPYLMRRLAERPANVLLLAGSVLRDSPLGVLVPDRNGSGT